MRRNYNSLVRKLYFIVIVIAISGCAEATSLQKEDGVNLPLAYEGYTGIYEGFTLKLDERFDDFDNAAWVTGDGAVGKEAACRFQPQGVVVTGGLLNLVVREEPIEAGWSEDHEKEKPAYQFSCGELRSHNSKRVRYGRFETRMRAPARAVASGYISSLFTYNFEGEQPEWEEIDVELEGGRPDKFQANLIYGKNTWAWSGTRQWGAWEDKIEIGPVDEWRVYAFEWLPGEIRWYVDGVLMKTLKQSALDCKPACVPPQVKPTPIPDNTTDLMMNFWIPNDVVQNYFGGNKKDNVYPMRAQYDWLRIYELDEEPFPDW